MSDIYDNAQIEKICHLYTKRCERDRVKYQRKKDDPEFIKQNRLRAKAHYETIYKEKKKQNYENNKQLLQIKSLFRYYKKNDRVEAFKTKYPERYQILQDHGFDVSVSGSGSNV
tara:strand:- start:9296 stop:9637 length:342 start_codon:yes stop_codon:yes gene_type:complete